MKQTIPLLTTVLLLLVNSLFSQTIYVNSNTGDDITGNGTIGSPYKTFHKGYTMCSSNGTLDLMGVFTWSDVDETGDVYTAGYVLNKNLTIQGHGINSTIIQSEASENTANRRIFTITSSYTITFKNLTLRNGRTNDGAGSGGAVFIENVTTDIIFENCLIESNNVKPSSYSYVYGGGAIWYKCSNSSNQRLIIRGCVLRKNNAINSWGGAIYNSNANLPEPIGYSSVVIENSTLDSNYAFFGAACAAYYGSYEITNSTITHNTAFYHIINLSNHNTGNLYLTNVTIADNTMISSGRALDLEGNLNTFIKNTIIARNFTIDGVQSDFHSDIPITNNGNNLVETGYDTFFTNGVNGCITGVQPNLYLSNILSDNGSNTITKTLALLNGSVAINAGETGTNNTVTIPVNDQRGFNRFGNIDMGAYEYQPSCINPTSGGIISGNQTICGNTAPIKINNSILPNFHSGYLLYQWQMSTTSNSSGYTDISGATDSTYQPGILNTTTWFKRLSKASCNANWIGASESNIVTITVENPPIPSFTMNNVSQCLNGNNFEFTNTSTNATSYLWNFGDETIAITPSSNHTYTSSGTYEVKIIASNDAGCKDSISYSVVVKNVSTSVSTITACDSYTWIDGNIYTASNNTATHNIVGGATNGCDSLVTLNLTINYSATGTDVINACNSYTWIDGNIYTANNNNATHNIVGGAANGCDSLVTLNLTINYSNTGTDVITACNSYTWIDGITYTSSNNTATHTLQNSAGCDSVVTLNLTINYSNTGTDVITACNSYTWIDGITYTTSNNTATHTLTNYAGCDSVVTLNLTINYSTTGTDVITACNSYTWIDGNIYTASNNTATHNIVGGAASGCDSLITLNLTINSADTSVVVSGLTLRSQADGAIYQWLDCANSFSPIQNQTSQNFVASINGSYAVEVTENGCTDTSFCIDITNVKIENQQFESSINLYPNPTDGKVNIDFDQKQAEIKLVVRDITGKVIFENFYSNTNRISFNFEEPRGFYIVELSSVNENAVFKLIKQ